MSNKIDGYGAGYVIPGGEPASPANVGREAAVRPSFSDVIGNRNQSIQYSNLPSVKDMTAVFSLHHHVPAPEDISPPPKPLSLEEAPRFGSSAETYLSMLRNALSPGTVPTAVKHMLDQLQGQQKVSRSMRNRSEKGRPKGV